MKFKVIFSFLFLTTLTLNLAQAACSSNCDKSGYKYSMDSKYKNDLEKFIENSFDAAWKERANNAHQVTKKDANGNELSLMKVTFGELIQNLFEDGYLSSSESEQWRQHYLSLDDSPKKPDPDADNWLNKGAWWDLYWKWGFKDKVASLSNKQISCIKTGQKMVNGVLTREVGTAQCCQQTQSLHEPFYSGGNISDNQKPKLRHKLLWLGFNKNTDLPPAQRSCLDSGQSCSNSSDCCSKICTKSDPFDTSSQGTCSAVEACYRMVQYNEQCDPVGEPYCAQDKEIRQKTKESPNNYTLSPANVKCLKINHQSSGIGECNGVGAECTSNDGCCSGLCESGKCKEQYKCNACIGRGKKLSDVNPSDRASYEDVNSGNPSGKVYCCPGFWADESEDDPRCLPTFPPLMIDGLNSHFKIKHNEDNFSSKDTNLIVSFLEGVIDFIMPSAHANSSSTGDQGCAAFSKEAEDEISAEILRCMNLEDESDKESCLKGVSDTKDRLRNERSNEIAEAIEEKEKECSNPTIASNQQAYQICMQQLEELRDQEGCNGMSTQDYINSYNLPQIRSKTYSDPKTCKFNTYNDDWRDSTTIERNARIVTMGFEYLFSGVGAHDYWVAADSNNLNIFERSKKIASQLRDKRVELINQFRALDITLTCKCVKAAGGATAGFSSEVMDIFNNHIECAKDKAALDAMNSLDSSDGSSNAEVTSLGASGITGNEFMATYAQSRTNIKGDLKTFYDERVGEIEELSEYINNVNWYETTIEEEHHLYDFKVRWLADWVAIVVAVVLTIVAAVVTFFTAGLALAIVLAVVVGVAGGLAASAINSSLNAQFLSDYPPHIKDKTTNVSMSSAWDESKKEWRWSEGKSCDVIFKCFKIKRYYVHPTFNNSEQYGAQGNNVCDIKSSANLCVRSVYGTEFEEEGRFLIDAKRPLFVSSSSYSEDSGYVQKVNETIPRIVAELKKYEPTKENNSQDYLEDSPIDELTRDSVLAAMLPGDGGANPFIPEEFTAARESAVIEAVKTFSNCKEITGDLAIDECKVTADENGNDLKEGSMGFGNFFESEEDINDFAAYFYQHHFHWPSITVKDQLGYPLLAQSAYYQAVLNNLRILQVSTQQRELSYGDAYDAYLASYELAASNYDCTPEDGNSGAQQTSQPICAVIESGLKAENAKYSNNYRNKIKQLSLNMGDPSVANPGSKSDLKVGNGDNLSDAELAGIQAAQREASRQTAQLKKRKSFDKLVGNTGRGKLITKASENWNKAFSSPMTRMKMTRGGLDYGNKSGSKIASNSYANKNLKNNKLSSFNTKSTFKNPFSTKRGRSKSYGGYKSSSPYKTNFNSNKSTMTQKSKDYSNLLDMASKNQKMFKRDDSDSIFTIISKTYFRNLSLILKRNEIESEKKKEDDVYEPKMKKLKGSKKDELKKLLGN